MLCRCVQRLLRLLPPLPTGSTLLMASPLRLEVLLGNLRKVAEMHVLGVSEIVIIL